MLSVYVAIQVKMCLIRDDFLQKNWVSAVLFQDPIDDVSVLFVFFRFEFMCKDHHVSPYIRQEYAAPRRREVNLLGTSMS